MTCPRKLVSVSLCPSATEESSCQEATPYRARSEVHQRADVEETLLTNFYKQKITKMNGVHLCLPRQRPAQTPRHPPPKYSNHALSSLTLLCCCQTPCACSGHTATRRAAQPLPAPRTLTYDLYLHLLYTCISMAVGIGDRVDRRRHRFSGRRRRGYARPMRAPIYI
jgi:hypothetical protein